MTEASIRKEISGILCANGFNVVASEVREGFSKPAVFVSVYPSAHEKLMCGREQITNSVEIKYIPAVETEAECISVNEKLCNLFFYRPITIDGTIITVERIETEIDEYILSFMFELTYEQLMPCDTEYDAAEILDLRMEE